MENGFRLVDDGRVSEHAAVNERMRRILSMTLLLAALGMFVAFHFLIPANRPGRPDESGWTIWSEIFRLLGNPNLIEPRVGFIASSFLMFALLVTTAPFLPQAWLRSRLAWCFVTAFSGISAIGFSSLILLHFIRSEFQFQLGGWFLIISPILNFLGLLLARRWQDEPRNPVPETNPPRQSS